MPVYEYRCPTHGRTEIIKPMDEASQAEYCIACCNETAREARAAGYKCWMAPAPMRRIYNPQRIIIRPSGWNLHPEDPKYSFFDRELELGEVRDPGDKAESGGATTAAPDIRVDHATASPEAERNLYQAVAAALGES